MAKIKAKKAKTEIEGDESNEICTSNPRPITENADEDKSPSVPYSKGKKKKTKKLNRNRIDPSNEDSPQEEESNSNPIEAQQKEELKGLKKKKKKNSEKEIKGDEEEQNDGCHLPGQKHERPHERDPLRIFLEVLHQQLPDCDLATTWMMEWGLLPPEEATDIYERQLKENETQGLVSPMPAVTLKKASKVHSKKLDKASPNTIPKAKKRKVSETTSDDDLMSSKKKKTKKHKLSSG